MDAFLISAAQVESPELDGGPLDPGHLDPSTFGPMSGPVEIGDLGADAFDGDGDGVVDSHVVHAGDAVVVASDFDRDGNADRVTMIESDGDYSAWECRRGIDGALVWHEIDAGTL